MQYAGCVVSVYLVGVMYLWSVCVVLVCKMTVVLVSPCVIAFCPKEECLYCCSVLLCILPVPVRPRGPRAHAQTASL